MELKNALKVRKGLAIEGSGSILLDVKGSKGQLLSVTDTITDSLFAVNDISGIPVLEVFDNDTVKLGTYNDEGLTVVGSNVTVGNNLFVVNDVSGSNFKYVGSGSIGLGLTVGGDVSGSNLDFTGSGSIGQSLLVQGNLSGSNFEFTGSGSIAENLNVGGDVSGSNFKFDGSGSVGDDLTVGGDVSGVNLDFTGSGSVDLNFNIGGDVTATNFDFAGSGSIGGDLIVGGILTAQEFYTEYVSSSVIFESGSTKFGDTEDDIHEFTGSIRLRGSQNYDSYITGGKLGIGTATPSKTLTVQGGISGSSTLDIDGNTTLDGTLTVGGNTTIEGNQITLSSTSVTMSHTGEGGDFLIQSNGNPDSNLILSSSNEIRLLQTTELYNLSSSFRSPNYESGFTGQGFTIEYASQSSAEFDNLTVRGSMRIFELLINQIRATNGSLFVSSVGKVDTVEEVNSTTFILTFDTGSGILGHGFTEDDIIRAQRVNRSAITGALGESNVIDDFLVYRSDMKVEKVQDLRILTASLVNGSQAPSSSFEYVRLGNETNTDRQGNIYLTSDDKNAPFIDVVDGITSHGAWNNAASNGGVKVRMGRLDGIATETFGDLEGYGMWASGSAYLEGGINATFGEVGGFIITSDTIKDRVRGTTLVLKSDGQITGSQVLFDGGLIGGFNITDKLIQSIRVDASEFIQEVTNDGGDTFGTTHTNTVYNDFKFDPTTLVSPLNAGSDGVLYGFDQVDRDLVLHADGNITGSKVLFKGGRITGSNSSFVIEVDDFTAKGQNIEISGSNFHLLKGNITASNVDLSGKITATSGKIGGFEITQDAITGSNFYLSGSAGLTDYFISSSNFQVRGNGDVSGSNVFFTGGKISGSTLTIDVTDLTAKGNSVEISGSNFHLLSGNITASNVDLSGKIDAESGRIGGFEITDSAITGSNFYLSGSAGLNDFFISSSNFQVLGNGNLTATNADLSGKVTATTGRIGGFEITEDAITGSNFYLSGSAGNDDYFISSSNFQVLGNGNITATNTDLTGKITATSGRVGGFEITQDAITGSGFFLSGSPTTTGFFISSSNFVVKGNGDLTASNANIKGIISATGGFISGALSMSNAGAIVVGDSMLIDPDQKPNLLVPTTYTSSVDFGQAIINTSEGATQNAVIGGYEGPEFWSANYRFSSSIEELNQNADTLELSLSITTGSITVSSASLWFFSGGLHIETTQDSNPTHESDWETIRILPIPLYREGGFRDPNSLDVNGNIVPVGSISFDTLLIPIESASAFRFRSETLATFLTSSTGPDVFNFVLKNSDGSDNPIYSTYGSKTLVNEDGIFIKSTPSQDAIRITGLGDSLGGGAVLTAGGGGEVGSVEFENLTDRVVDLENFSSSLDTVYATDAKLDEVSSSLDTRITSVSSSLDTDKVNDGGGVVNEIAVWSNGTTISGSSNLNFANAVLEVGGKINATGEITGTNFQGTNFNFTGNGNVDGNLDVGGTLTAQQFKIEYVNSTVINQSGSTKFGDNLGETDTHQFTGSIFQTGSNDSYFLGNLSVGASADNTPESTKFTVHGAISASSIDLSLGTLNLGNSLLSFNQSSSIDTTTSVISSVPTESYDAVFFDYLIKQSSNLRAGTIYSVHYQGSVEFTETSTQDLGDTTDVTLDVVEDQGQIKLRATTLSNSWTVKALARGI